jgi:hypothetical protein
MENSGEAGQRQSEDDVPLPFFVADYSRGPCRGQFRSQPLKLPYVEVTHDSCQPPPPGEPHTEESTGDKQAFVQRSVAPTPALAPACAPGLRHGPRSRPFRQDIKVNAVVSVTQSVAHATDIASVQKVASQIPSKAPLERHPTGGRRV